VIPTPPLGVWNQGSQEVQLIHYPSAKSDRLGRGDRRDRDHYRLSPFLEEVAPGPMAKARTRRRSGAFEGAHDALVLVCAGEQAGPGRPPQGFGSPGRSQQGERVAGEPGGLGGDSGRAPVGRMSLVSVAGPTQPMGR